MRRLILLLISTIIALVPIISINAQTTEDDLRDAIIDVAKGELGYVEGYSNYTKYGTWYGWQGAWCTTFVIWCANEAGNNEGVSIYKSITPSGGSCNDMISWFKKHNEYYKRSSDYSPQKGDFVFFDWNKDGWSDHVGLVEYVKDGVIHTIEGNTSDAVKRRTYSSSGGTYSSVYSIMGYGAVDYASAVSSKSSSNKKDSKTSSDDDSKNEAKSTTKENSTANTSATKKVQLRQKAKNHLKTQKRATKMETTMKLRSKQLLPKKTKLTLRQNFLQAVLAVPEVQAQAVQRFSAVRAVHQALRAIPSRRTVQAIYQYNKAVKRTLLRFTEQMLNLKPHQAQN